MPTLLSSIWSCLFVSVLHAFSLLYSFRAVVVVVYTQVKGSYVYIPKHVKHKVIKTSQNAVWLAVHHDGEPGQLLSAAGTNSNRLETVVTISRLVSVLVCWCACCCVLVLVCVACMRSLHCVDVCSLFLHKAQKPYHTANMLQRGLHCHDPHGSCFLQSYQ